MEPADLSEGAAPPPDDWLILVNRQSVAVRLLATTVHDVNNILQVMSGAAEVLALDPTPAAVAKRTTAIVTQSLAATGVLHTLTSFLREESDPLAGARPLALARQAVTFRQHALRKARLSAAVDGDDAVCAMASHRLLQVLLNLVLNAEHALKGRSDGVIAVQVTDGDPVAIVVTDNGTGMPPEIHAAAPWPPQPGGAVGALGIGLRAVRALVTDAHGSIAFDDVPGGGARVTVSVPRLRT